MSSLSSPSILFIPFPSPGHYLPLLHMASILSSRGARSTFIIPSPSILSHLPPSISPNLQFLSLPFPFPSISSLSDLHTPFLHLLRHLSPSALISDSLLPFAFQSAASLNIPCFSFPGTGLFSLSIDRRCPTAFSSVPGLPHHIQFSHSQLKYTTLPGDPTKQFFNLAKKAEDEFSSGLVVNTFEELEPGYAEHYRREVGKPVFMIGPVSAISRGGDQDGQIVDWLNKKREGSVIYVCFGSLCRLPEKQVLEIGGGLEDSGVEFLWVIREGSVSAAVEMMVEEMEGRIGDRGLVVKGWIGGQAGVLRQASVGGFLTHCGWGAVTEAAAAGVPMLTWPMFGEQFYNEKLVNEVVGIGVGIGVKEGFVWGEEEKIGVLVGRERICERVRFLMDGSDGSDGEIGRVRKRVKEMGDKARMAMVEGGDSYNAVDSLLELCRQVKA